MSRWQGRGATRSPARTLARAAVVLAALPALSALPVLAAAARPAPAAAARPAAPPAIANDRLRIAFDQQGRLCRITNRATGAECVAGPPRLPLTILRRDGAALAPVRLAYAGSSLSRPHAGQALTLRYAGEGVSAALTIRVRPGDGLTRWDLSLANRGDVEVLEAVCPDLAGLRIGPEAADDVLVRPNRFGQRIPHPARNLVRRPGEIVDGLLYHEGLNTPTLIYNGSAGMFWMDLSDARGGLYLASEDRTLIGGYLTAVPSPAGGVGLALGKYVRLTRGQSIRLPWAVGVHPGDWRWGADRYRAWASAFMRRPNPPRWAREMPNWYWRAMIWSMGAERPSLTTSFRWADLGGPLMDGALALHSAVIGLAGQEFMGHDFPFWWPDPTLGGDDALRREVASLRRRGGRVVPYLNPIYLWEDFPAIPHADDPEFRRRLAQAPPDVAALRPDWAVHGAQSARLYNGAVNYVEQHYFGRYPQACMQSRDWQDFMLAWTAKYCRDYGFSGVQWDQLGAYPMQYCTDWTHGHTHHGVGPPGVLELCRRAWSDPRYRLDPDFMIWYEGASDVAAQYLANGHSAFDMWMAWSFPEMIQYTFPWCTFSGETVPLDGAVGQALVRRQRTMEMSFLCREKLGSGGGEHGRKLAAIAEITNALKGLYWYTDYLGDRGLTLPRGIVARALRVDPAISPSTRQPAIVIPYCDTRAVRPPATLRLSASALALTASPSLPLASGPILSSTLPSRRAAGHLLRPTDPDPSPASPSLASAPRPRRATGPGLTVPGPSLARVAASPGPHPVGLSASRPSLASAPRPRRAAGPALTASLSLASTPRPRHTADASDPSAADPERTTAAAPRQTGIRRYRHATLGRPSARLGSGSTSRHQPTSHRACQPPAGVGAISHAWWYPGHLHGARIALRLTRCPNGDLMVRLPAIGPESSFTRESAYCAADGTTSRIGAIVLSADDLRHLAIVAPAETTRSREILLRTVTDEPAGDGPTAFAIPPEPRGDAAVAGPPAPAAAPYGPHRAPLADASIDGPTRRCARATAVRSTRSPASASPAAVAGLAAPTGLNQVEVADGSPELALAAGRRCWRMGLPRAPYIYFRADLPALRTGVGPLEVAIDYLDEGVGAFRLQYNSADPFAAPYADGRFVPEYKSSAWVLLENTRRWRTAHLLLPDARLTGRMNGAADLRIDCQSLPLAVSRIAVTLKRVRRIPAPGVALRIGSHLRRTDSRGELRYRFAPDDPVGAYILEARRDDRTGLLPVSATILVRP